MFVYIWTALLLRNIKEKPANWCHPVLRTRTKQVICIGTIAVAVIQRTFGVQSFDYPFFLYLWLKS